MIFKSLLLALLSALLSFIAGRRTDVPTYKGGQDGLNSFIFRTIIYPEYSKYNCLQGTVNVSFRLNRRGRIVQSQIERGLGIDLDDEALRVVRLTSGKWTVPTEFDTTQFLTIPINFSLKEYNCESKSREEIREAISAYKAREDLTKAIINYYQHRDESSVNFKRESEILALKTQMGYDDRFIDRTIRQANQKLRQGDKESACEDYNLVKNLGSDRADKLITDNCKK